MAIFNVWFIFVRAARKFGLSLCRMRDSMQQESSMFVRSTAPFLALIRMSYAAKAEGVQVDMCGDWSAVFSFSRTNILTTQNAIKGMFIVVIGPP